MHDASQTLLGRNRVYARDHRSRPPLPTLDAIVVSCLDARTDPAHFLGVAPGEALVMRNAGGRVTEAVEQELGVILAMAAKMTGQPVSPEIVIVHHTDCGMAKLADPGLAAHVCEASDVAPEVVGRLAIDHLDESLADDVERLRSSPYLPPGLTVTALRYDEASGFATTLEPEAAR